MHWLFVLVLVIVLVIVIERQYQYPVSVIAPLMTAFSIRDFIARASTGPAPLERRLDG